jgi:hypothetical protein
VKKLINKKRKAKNEYGKSGKSDDNYLYTEFKKQLLREILRMII